MVVDFRQDAAHSPIDMDEDAVERVSTFQFLRVTLSDDLKWTEHATAVPRKAHQRLDFLRHLRTAPMSTTVLCSFYRCAVSILTGCIPSCYELQLQ